MFLAKKLNITKKEDVTAIFKLVDEIESQTPASFETILSLYGFNDIDSMKSEQNIKVMLNAIKDSIMPLYPYELLQLLKAKVY